MTNEFILQDRIQKIQQIIDQYGEENFSISYSGGKDSNVLSALFDMALPENKIPRVYCNTGIEYRMIVDFVKAKAAEDDRFIIIHPKVKIKQMLEEKGYPFKSKLHSAYYKTFEKQGKNCRTIQIYLKLDPAVEKYRNDHCCPKKLEYQFEENNGLTFRISNECCHYMKVNPLETWSKEHKKSIKILGIMTDEGGRRAYSAKCLAFAKDKLRAFQPLIPITKEWEDWFIEKYGIQLPALYYPPYSFQRTGCKGCPYAIDLQDELDIMSQYLPNERKQCEIIWAPVYKEYRRLGYRLRQRDENQLTFEELEKEI